MKCLHVRYGGHTEAVGWQMGLGQVGKLRGSFKRNGYEFCFLKCIQILSVMTVKCSCFAAYQSKSTYNFINYSVEKKRKRYIKNEARQTHTVWAVIDHKLNYKT